jgi:hypothetical protein
MSKKYKILLETKDYKEVEIILPFYAYYQGEMEKIFVKITAKDFKQITFHQYGKCELFKCNTHNSIAAIWHDNKSDWKQWQEAVRNAKSYVQFF